MSSDYVINLMDIDTFPELPSSNLMTSNVVTVLSESQTVKFEALTVSETESWEIEKNLRLQSRDLRWHSITKDGITASNAGEIAKRRKDGQKLAERLRSTRHVTTAAMKHGWQSEGLAANEYRKRMDDCQSVPSGIIVIHFVIGWLQLLIEKFTSTRATPLMVCWISNVQLQTLNYL